MGVKPLQFSEKCFLVKSLSWHYKIFFILEDELGNFLAKQGYFFKLEIAYMWKLSFFKVPCLGNVSKYDIQAFIHLSRDYSQLFFVKQVHIFATTERRALGC